jgi:5-methylcytosine-specific restriction endonuclease McrA
MARPTQWHGEAARRARDRVRRRRLPCCLCGKPIDYSLPKSHPMSFTLEHKVSRLLAPELMFDSNNHDAAHRSCNSSKGTGSGEHLRPLPASREW